MHDRDWLAEQFEANRAHLQGVAYRMLGSRVEADDAVQEAWLRLSRSDTESIDNLGGWLTTVVARVCLDSLRARSARPEESIDAHPAPPRADERPSAEDETLLAESVGLAMMVVLKRLEPSERVAFVLHDMFDLPFDQIAQIVGKSEPATRQLASRARRRVRGGSQEHDATLEERGALIDAFLNASRAGDMEGLVRLLDPNVVLRADALTVSRGSPAEMRGADAVAKLYMGRAATARAAIIDGDVGFIVAPKGNLFLVMKVGFANGRIASIEAIGEPSALAALDISAF